MFEKEQTISHHFHAYQDQIVRVEMALSFKRDKPFFSPLHSSTQKGTSIYYNLRCGVAQKEAHRAAVRRPRVRFSARHQCRNVMWSSSNATDECID
jgi:hypothetical protein